jgi:CheY-like chemotaxis protein
MSVVVEDDFLVRLAIVDYLTANGCTVIEAASGEEAVGVINGRDSNLHIDDVGYIFELSFGITF